MEKKRTGPFSLAEEPRNFEAAIDGFLKQGCSRAEAVRAAVRFYPELHESYIQRINEGRAKKQ